MKKSRFTAVVFGVLFLLLAVNGHAGPVLGQVLEEKVLRVGTSGAQPPMTAVTKSGGLIGMDIDIATAMASAMGVEVKFVTMPFAKLLPALKAGSVDMVISGMTVTPSRNLEVAFVGPYLVSGKGILGKRSKYLELQEAEGLNTPSVTVAVLKDSTSQEFADELVPEAKQVLTESYEEAIDLIEEDRADVLIADYPFCALAAYRHRTAGLIAGKNPLTYEPIGIAMREDPLLINWVRNFISLLQGNGQLKTLHQKWLGGGAWIDELP